MPDLHQYTKNKVNIGCLVLADNRKIKDAILLRRLEIMPLKNKLYRAVNPLKPLLLILTITGYMHPASATELKINPEEVRGPDACGECHKKSVEIWKATPHATTFQNLPRSEKA